MAQHEVELILVRQLASYLTLPMIVVNAAGTLIFFNEPAEPLLGRRFDETDELPLAEWSAVHAPADAAGKILPSSARPLLVALGQHRPASGVLQLRSLTGETHEVEVTAFPLVGQGGRELGAVALLWPMA